MRIPTVFYNVKTRTASVSKRHRLFRFSALPLSAALIIPIIARAQTQPVPPLSGVLGKIQSFTGNSLDVVTSSGVVRITVAQPLATYKQIPSDLSRVTSNSYVGVASVQQVDGTELAKQVIIFPKELRGAAEGSVPLDAPGATTHNRTGRLTTLRSTWCRPDL